MEKIMSADGTPIAFERTGSGPPLVLVHGTTANHTRWASVLPGLSKHCTVYAIDRRGVGESGDADEYDLDREIEDIIAIVDSIDEPVILLGHSFGALCTLGAALRLDSLRALVLYEPVFPTDENELYSTELLEELEELLENGENERLLVLLLRDMAGYTPTQLDELRSGPTWQSRIAAAHTVLRETLVEHEYVFEPDRFREMTTLTVLYTGIESPESITEPTIAIDEALPNSRIIEFCEQGHAAMISAPDRFVDEVLAVVHLTN